MHKSAHSMCLALQTFAYVYVEVTVYMLSIMHIDPSKFLCMNASIFHTKPLLYRIQTYVCTSICIPYIHT